jgi:formylglycine-generating enzyme required for sulfatase activity
MPGAPPLVAVPAGRFLMGAGAGRPDEQPVHAVEVGSFRLGLTPVTRAQYAPFLETGPVDAPPWWNDPAFRASDQPVVGVTWDDASAYAEWLSRLHGGRWRLPTEAEWEWAARGGLAQAATSWGDALPPGEVPDGPLDGPWRVGRGTPNGFGLLDMGTVVHEWCLDWYAAAYYADAPLRDPRGPEEGERRASRGGSWRHRVRWSPPSARSSLPPSSRYADYGFRVLCASG